MTHNAYRLKWKLTTEEENILAGKDGQGAAMAMKVLVGIAQAFDAPRMVPISRAHVALSNQEADLWFAEKLSANGARCRITPTVNPGFSLDFFTAHSMVSKEDANLMRRTQDAYRITGCTYELQLHALSV